MSNSQAASIRNVVPKSVRVLLVEDNQADVYLMKHFFEALHFPGIVDHVGDGMEALHYLNREGRYSHVERPDLVLLDLGLPKLNGHEVLQRIRLDPEYDDLPIIVLSTSKTESDSAKSISLGANGFITKPSDLDEIESLIRRLVLEDIPQLLAGR